MARRIALLLLLLVLLVACVDVSPPQEGEGEGEGEAEAECLAAVDAYVMTSEADGCDAARLCQLGLLRERCSTTRAAELRDVVESCLADEACRTPLDAAPCVQGQVADLGERAETASRICACGGGRTTPWDECDQDRAELRVMSDDEAATLLTCMREDPSCDNVNACVDASPYIQAVASCVE